MSSYLDRVDFSKATYGMEIEAAGMRRDTPLDPDTEGEWCRVEGSIHDRYISIGNDPLGEYNLLGGEIKVKYAHSKEELFNRVIHLLEKTKCPKINMPSTMHQHIVLPDLYKDENLDILKHIVEYNQRTLPTIIHFISPLPSMEFIQNQKYHSEEQRKMFVRAYKDKHNTRHSIYSDKQIERMMSKTTFVDFINAIADVVNSKTGKPMWNVHMRRGVNFAKMRASDGGTLEFRMFSATDDKEILKNIIEFPERYLRCALEDKEPSFVYDLKWPDYYDWTMEDNETTLRWIHTDADKIDRKEILSYLETEIKAGRITLDMLGNPPYWDYLK